MAKYKRTSVNQSKNYHNVIRIRLLELVTKHIQVLPDDERLHSPCNMISYSAFQTNQKPQMQLWFTEKYEHTMEWTYPFPMPWLSQCNRNNTCPYPMQSLQSTCLHYQSINIDRTAYTNDFFLVKNSIDGSYYKLHSAISKNGGHWWFVIERNFVIDV